MSLVRIPVPGTDREITATLVEGKPMVSLRHACEALGIDFSNYVESDRRLFDQVWENFYQ